jgi:putative peptidoglycan lipid II flippase
MVKRIFRFIGKEITGLHEAAYLLALFSFFSLVLGLIRDRLLAGEFGASLILDVYYTSFRLPDLLFVVVTSLVSASVLVPVFSKHLSDQAELKRHVDSLFTVFIAAMILICVVVFIFTPQILRLTAPGLIYGEMSNELILFTRILLLSPILLGISQLFGGIVQAYRKFVLYAISPILYNLGIILGILFFYPIFGNIGLIYGVCLGLVFHVLVQMPVIGHYRLIPKITFKIDKKIVKHIFALSLPRTVALASSQIILVVLVALASKMEEGSVAVFSFSYNLQSVPLTIIGVSYSLAAFPTLSRFFHEGNMEKFMASIVTSARHIIFWSLPIIVMFVVLRAQIVRTILGSGQFDWSATRLTAAALAIFIVSALAQSLVLLFVRGYYAAGETRKPLMINTICSLIVIGLSFVFVSVYRANEGLRLFFENLLRVEGDLPSTILMLPLAFSFGIILNAIILWIVFEKSFERFSAVLWRPFWQSGLASLLAGLLVLVLLKNHEIREVSKTLHHRIWGVKVITSGQEEL